VFQCYYPELNYTDKGLYEHQRDKITKDIAKLLNNGKKLKSLGISNIKEWHFMTPNYTDKKLIQHCENKRKEVLIEKKAKELDYIDDNFQIILKTERDYLVEINRIVNLSKDIKLDFALKPTGTIDWNKCPSEKVENIQRKIKAIMPDSGHPSWPIRYNRMVETHVEFYLKGIELLGKVKTTCAEFYEKLFELEYICRMEVQQKCDLHDDSAINKKVFEEILKDFETKLKEEFGDQITLASIMELKQDLVSAWLADCPMDFR
jgi:hypothetical protein